MRNRGGDNASLNHFFSAWGTHRQDEAGTPYRVIADESSLETGIVSLQDRDTTASVSDFLVPYLCVFMCVCLPLAGGHEWAGCSAYPSEDDIWSTCDVTSGFLSIGLGPKVHIIKLKVQQSNCSLTLFVLVKFK